MATQKSSFSTTIHTIGQHKLVAFSLLVGLFALVVFQATLFQGIYTFITGSRARLEKTLTNPLAEDTNDTASTYVPGEIIVKLRTNPLTLTNAATAQKNLDKDAVSMSDIDPLTLPLSFSSIDSTSPIIQIEKVFKQEGLQGKEAEAAEFSTIYTIKIDSSTSIESLIPVLEEDPSIEYAEPNLIGHTYFVPNDPYYRDSYPNNTQRAPNWNPDHDYLWNLKIVNAEGAWDITRGDPSVLVAVVDTGVDYTHPEFDGCTLSMVNANTCKRIAPGYDFTNNDDNPMDDAGHGTHVAGTIAATQNNAGIVGLAWNTRIIPVKAMDQRGQGHLTDAVNGIRYATFRGARVINMSFGFEAVSLSKTLKHVLDYALARDVVLIAASGNNASLMDNRGYWPADYPPVISVSATSERDEKASYSNFGFHIDVAAPGGENSNFLSLLSSGVSQPPRPIVGANYMRAQGTSMAAPMVSGLAALIASAHPNYSVEDIEAVIKNSADDIEPGINTFSGYGRINAQTAISQPDTLTPISMDILIPNDLQIGDIFSIPVEVHGETSGKRLAPAPFILEYTRGDLRDTSTGQWTTIATIDQSGRQDIRWQTANLTDGPYTLQLRTASDASVPPTRILIQKNSKLKTGWPKVIPFDYNGLPWAGRQNRPAILADINTDGTQEIVMSIDDSLYVFGTNSRTLPGWPVNLLASQLESSVDPLPAVGDIDPQIPGLEIAILRTPIGRDLDESKKNVELFVYSNDGQLLSQFGPFSVPGESASFSYTSIESLVIDDVTGDGKNDVLFAIRLLNQRSVQVYVVEADGNTAEHFPLTVITNGEYSNVEAGILTGNFTNSPGKELVVYTKSSGYSDDSTTNVGIYTGGGTLISGWPLTMEAVGLGPVKLSDLSIGNFDPTTAQDEIAIQSGTRLGITKQYIIYAADAQEVGRKQLHTNYITFPMVGDINNDGVNDLFLQLNTDKQIDYFSTRSFPGLPIDNPTDPINLNFVDPLSLGAMVDLGNDQTTDILLPMQQEGRYGFRSFTYENNSFVDGPIAPIMLTNSQMTLNPLSVGDIDANGTAELVTGYSEYGYFILNTYETNLPLGKHYWPQYGQNSQHTGSYIEY